MARFLKYLAIAATGSSAAGAVIGTMPSQTMGGFGEPILALPLATPAPEVELVKRRLERKDVTNICTEWTIPGGFGQPECINSETCLFTSAYGYYYEGCGQTSIKYNWITECWDYPQYGTAPISQLYCSANAPYCGFFAFVFGVDYTFWNFGCSTVAYSLFVDLLPSTTGEASSAVVLAGGGTSQITPIATTVYVTQQPSIAGGGTSSVLLPPGMTPNAAQPTSTSSASSSPSQLPTINSHAKSSTSRGPIIGGTIGGIALIALLSFLLWFYLRKRKQDRAFAEAAAQNEQQQADAATAIAFHNHNRIAEVGGTPKPAGAYLQPSSPGLGVYPEKQTVGVNTVDIPSGSQSPPPSYERPLQPSPSSIPSQPVSQTSYGGQPQRQEINELGGTIRGGWNVPQGVQEMSANSRGITRKPVGASGSGTRQYMDMSGAPMSEEFHSHELE